MLKVEEDRIVDEYSGATIHVLLEYDYIGKCVSYYMACPKMRIVIEEANRSSHHHSPASISLVTWPSPFALSHIPKISYLPNNGMLLDMVMADKDPIEEEVAGTNETQKERFSKKSHDKSQLEA